MTDLKLVPWHGLVTHSQVYGIHQLGSYRGGRYEVCRKGPDSVELLDPNFKALLTVPSNNSFFEVCSTMEELRAKYEAEAARIVSDIRTVIPVSDVGKHILDKKFLTFDPYEMAAACERERIRIIGHSVVYCRRTSGVLYSERKVAVCLQSTEDPSYRGCVVGNLMYFVQMFERWNEEHASKGGVSVCLTLRPENGS